MNKRKIFSSFLRYSGFFHGLRTFSDGQTLCIIMYHRIFKHPDKFSYYLTGVTPEMFNAQMRFLSRHFAAISLEDAVDRIHSGQGLPKNAVSVTIDDGYEDCYTFAYPVFKKYGIPATIYVTTNQIGSSEAFWVDKIGYIFKEGNHRKQHYANSVLGQMEFGHAHNRRAYVEQVIQKLKLVSDIEKNDVIRDLKDFFQVSDKDLKVDYNLTWAQIRKMSENGISFGAHTVTHPILTRIPLSAAEREIAESKLKIEAEIKKQVYGFCYPNGTEADFDESIITVLKRLGFTYALSTIWGFNNMNSDLFRLKRVGPNDDDDMAAFDCIVSGGFELSNRIRKIISKVPLCYRSAT